MLPGVLFLFIALFFCKVHGKTRLLLANMTGTGINAKVRATCLNDDYNDAITWITQSTNLIGPISGSESLHYVDYNWKKYGWDIEVAYNATFGPVMDYTWEMFPIIMTRSAQLTQNYKFEKIGEINIKNRFEINFSFLGKSSAQIYLCSNAEVKRGTCFIFILGGWNGKGSVIRRCKEDASPTNSDDRLRGCENIIHKIEHKPLFSIDYWSHISIRYINQQLGVIINEEHLLSYHANDQGKFNNFTRLFIHSNTENAMWKYHNYTYYEARKPINNFINSSWFYMDSNHLCISFFVKFTKDITLQLYDVSQELIKTEYYKSDQNAQWNYKTFYSDVHEDAEYYLRISFSTNDKVAIRNIVNHSDCKGSKTNNFHFSTLEYNFDSANNIKCSSLRHNTTQLKISFPNESTDVITSDNQSQCNICTNVYNTTECPHRITCNEKSCHCTTGYTGKYCDKICDRGKYGCNCAFECTTCISNFCNPANGECYFGCNDVNYVTPFCKERNLPVLTEIAFTQSDCVTNCTITIYDKELKYDGAKEPKYYYTRLFEPNGTITEGEITPTKVNAINFTNLTGEYKYYYEIVLCVTEEKSECFSEDLTTFQFKTTCAELQTNQILIESVDRRTTINVTSYNPSQNCRLDKYYLLIRDETSSAIQYSKHLELSNAIPSLDIFTDYTLQLTKNKKIIHSMIFTTDESVPNKVTNLTITTSTPSKLSVIWEAPTPALGIITNYVVTWMFLDKRGCRITNNTSNIQSKNITTTAIELDDLQPYSIYNISVSAVTKKGQGDMQSIIGYTDEAKTIDINMFNRKITTLETSIQIGLVVECENWNGSIYLSAYAICKSKWCEGDEMNRTKHMQYNDLITLDSLLSYTNYKLEVNFLRNEVDRINDYNKSWSTAVMTLSSVPNQVSFAEVYSLSETSISLRWSPPYPPTGILDSFKIKQYYILKSYRTQVTFFNYLSPCNIWPNMYCTTLTNLTTNQNYIISIAGRNHAISSYGVETFLNETTLIRAPQPPLNLVAKWDDLRILHLQWQHPNRTNGPLLKFKIIVNGQQYYHVVPENHTYAFKTLFKCKPETHQAIVSIQTINSKFTSVLLTQQFVCPILKPSLSTEPFQRRNINNSITISMPIVENAEIISNLYIIVLANELDDTCNCKEKLRENQKSLVPIKEKQKYWIVGHYQKSEYKEIVGTDVNINLSQIPEFNCAREFCEIGILIVNELDDQMSSNWYLVKQLEDTEFPSMFVYFFLLPIIIISIVVIIVLGSWAWSYNCSKKDTHTRNTQYSEILEYPTLPLEEIKSTEIKNEKCSRLVAVHKFNAYVNNVTNGDELTIEFNKIIALTQKTVKLRHVYSAAECFDASYISSPFCDKAYIFCSTPTVFDPYQFWKMVIAEEVENIVLFASTDDIKNEKFIQYWPDDRSIKSIHLSNIKVTTLKVYSFISIEIHHFKVQQANIVRETRFLHFTNWDIEGTQIHPDNIVLLLQLVQEIRYFPQRPILVHSLGKPNVGADMFILVHICIQQAQQEDRVDICHQVHNLRTQRPNFIDSVEEYLFAHLVLLQYINMPQNAYYEYYPAIYKKLDKDKFTQEMTNIEHSLKLMELLQTRYPILNDKNNPENNKHHILPHSSRSVFLSPPIDDNSCNNIAIFVDGFQQLKKFIVIQHPLKNNVDDFWKIVMDNNVHLAISLQTEYHIKPWKNDGHFITPNGLTVIHLRALETDHFYMHTLRLEQKEVSMEYIQVHIIEVKGWDEGQVLPHSLSILLKTRLQMNRMKCPEFKRILVMCRNGTTASGLFIATCNLLDSIESEPVVDVYRSVRNIRYNKRQFVTDEIQIRALFNIATLYLNNDAVFTDYSIAEKNAYKENMESIVKRSM